MQAIVTGGSGWLGKRLVKALLEGIPDAPHAKPPAVSEVVALARTPAELELLAQLGARPVRGDLTDPSTLAGLFVGDKERIVFHCAGLIHPARFTREFDDVNVRGTRNLLAAAAGAARFVHVSSNSPCGVNKSPSETFDESAPYDPYMAYGRTKAEGERLVRESGLPFVILRPPWFYGPGQPPRQSLFFRMIRDGKAPIVGSGENRRSMAYTDDIAQACLLAASHPQAPGGTFWIADARPYTMNEIISTIETVLERDFGIAVKHGRMKLPGFVGDVATLVDGTLQAAGLYHQKIHVLGEMNKTIACSIEHARAVLGYDPKVGLVEGMRRSVQALLDDGEKLLVGIALVTGGSGYFGSVVVRHLRARGDRVRVFDLIDTPDRPADVELVQGDIRSPDDVEKALVDVDVIHHNVAVVPLAKNKELFWTVNRDGTRVLLDEAKRAGVRKIVNVSSSAVFGAPDRNPVDESVQPAPGEEYGQAKRAGEILCEEAVARGQDVTIVRPRTIIGAGRLGIMQILFEWIRQGRALPLVGGGDNRYQFVSGDDLARACLLAADHAGPDVFHVGAEEFGTMKETLESLAAHAGTGSRVITFPTGPTVLAMKVANRLGLSPLGAYHALMYHRAMWFDVSHAKQVLGWSAQQSNADMFAEAYDWYLVHRDEVLAQRKASHHRSAVRPGILDLVSRLG